MAARCMIACAPDTRLGSNHAAVARSIASSMKRCKCIADEVRAGYVEGASGNVNQKVLPAPGVLSTPIVPPCCSMIWRLM
jgi:hypothetical protein